MITKEYTTIVYSSDSDVTPCEKALAKRYDRTEGTEQEEPVHPQPHSHHAQPFYKLPTYVVLVAPGPTRALYLAETRGRVGVGLHRVQKGFQLSSFCCIKQRSFVFKYSQICEHLTMDKRAVCDAKYPKGWDDCTMDSNSGGFFHFLKSHDMNDCFFQFSDANS